MKRDMRAIHNACKGRWVQIWEAFGIPADALDGRHHPCPTTGCPAQRDGFRVTNIADGTWICSGKGAEHHGDGFDLIMDCTGLPFGEALRQVKGIIQHAWAGHSEIEKYGTRRERVIMAFLDDIPNNLTEEDDGWRA